MKSIRMHELDDRSQLIRDVTAVLRGGGLVCLPCNSSYRIVADLEDEGAVNRLLQSKRRTRTAPSLVFVDSEKMLGRVVGAVEPMARRMVEKLWPGSVTILFPANPELPAKVVKQLVKANGRIGVRIPDDTLVREVVTGFGGPLLVSSANRERKQGAGSPAQVRKNFVSKLDLFIDAGDLPPAPASTVVNVDGDSFTVTRQGAVSEEQIARAAAQSSA